MTSKFQWNEKSFFLFNMNLHFLSEKCISMTSIITYGLNKVHLHSLIKLHFMCYQGNTDFAGIISCLYFYLWELNELELTTCLLIWKELAREVGERGGGAENHPITCKIPSCYPFITNTSLHTQTLASLNCFPSYSFTLSDCHVNEIIH